MNKFRIFQLTETSIARLLGSRVLFNWWRRLPIHHFAAHIFEIYRRGELFIVKIH